MSRRHHHNRLTRPFVTALSVDGLEAIKNFNNDYSSSNANVEFRPTSGTWTIARFLVYYRDGGNFPATHFGNIGGPLTNGILLQKVRVNSVVRNLTDVTEDADD